MPKQRAKHRLTGPLFLARYAKILAEGGMINLKTDSQFLHEFTKEVIAHNELPVEVANNDIYGTGYADETLSVKTAYESKFLAQGMPITYLRFSLGGKREFCDITEDVENKLQELRPDRADN
jgi:tRNA (guanine-N7-)-methyltransferase